MAQKPGEIRAHIKAEHEGLRENFEEIEDRVKSALDWKVWYRNNTAIALGGAAAGGILLSLLLRKGEEPEYFDIEEPEGPNYPPRMQLRKSNSRFHQVLDNTMSALFGVATDTFQDFMSKAVPGFREHYVQAESRRFE